MIQFVLMTVVLTGILCIVFADELKDGDEDDTNIGGSL